MQTSVIINLEKARLNMVKQQLRTNGVLNEKVLTAIERTAREQFVAEAYRQAAYADMNIPLPHDQIMLTPTEEARLLQVLAIQPTDQVLEIGTGSGYMTALLAQLAQQVSSVDIFADFTEQARRKLAQLSLHNIVWQTGDAARGWGEANSFDVIAITGSLPFLPDAFRNSLRIGGRLVAIIGEAPVMQAVLITRVTEKTWSEQTLFDTQVPALINALQQPEFIF